MLKKLNPLKRKIFKLITYSFKNKNTPIPITDFKRNRITRILIIRPNHRLGNQLLLSPLVQEIHNQIPNCEIDLLVNGGLSKILYQNYHYVHLVHNLPKKPIKNLFLYLKTSFKVLRKRYDLGISGCEDSNSGKIFLKLSRCNHKIYDSGMYKENKPCHIAQYPIYNLLMNQNINVHNKQIDYPKIDLLLSAEEINIGKQILHKMVSKDKAVVAIFTNATGTKKLSKEWWKRLYRTLKNELPDVNILEILPKENISQIDFKSAHYLSSDLREIASVIENCSLFIGTDSGMMHLAASTSTPTTGLFSVTKPEIYEPYGNNKRSILIDDSSQDEIINFSKKILT